jgi:hypothetical protein
MALEFDRYSILYSPDRSSYQALFMGCSPAGMDDSESLSIGFSGVEDGLMDVTGDELYFSVGMLLSQAAKIKLAATIILKVLKLSMKNSWVLG